MIHLDLDGPIADFDGHYFNCFGIRPTRWPLPDSTDWKLVNSVPDFFATIPMTHDALELLNGVGHPFQILTGTPKSVDVASNQKRDWVTARIVPAPPVVCCPAREKWMHGRPGDVLIDDFLKYADLWRAMGGDFIHHTSAAESLRQLRALGL